jgi:hypothetical protein
MVSALLQCILWLSFQEFSATVDLDIFPIFVLRLCSVILVLMVFMSLVYFFPHLHWMLHMQLFVFCILFFALVFVSMLYSIVCDLNVFWIFPWFPVWFFSNIPQIYHTAMVHFVVFWLMGLCFWLLLRNVFVNFGGYPFLTNVALKLAHSFLKLSLFQHIAVALFSRYLPISCLVQYGWLEV